MRLTKKMGETAHKMNWIAEFELKRESLRSNVFLFETSDPKRIEEYAKKFKVITYDIQRGVILDPKGNPRELEIGQDPLKFLDSILTSRQAHVLVRTAFQREHADNLADYLMAWSQDNNLFSHLSTVSVFTTDLPLFPNALLNLAYSIQIPPSSEEERKELLRKIGRGLSKKTNSSVRIPDAMVQSTSGLTLHDIETATLESYSKTRKIETETVTQYKIKKLQNFGLQYIVPSRGFQSVGGYDYLKHYIENRIIKIIKSPEIARKYGLRIPKGLLLFGPPGTGKTWFAKALSKEIGLPMITLSPADFLRGIVGESEARVRQVITLIESLSPILIFIDEFDQLALSRDRQIAGGGEVLRGVQNALLDWMGDEKRKAFFIGASNFISQLDPAFIRVGRIDDTVLFLYPDKEARKKILQIHCEVIRTIPAGDLNYDRLADETYMFNSAELEKVVLEASALAMDTQKDYVTMDHFKKALKGFGINTRAREKKIKEMITEMKKLENVNLNFLEKNIKEFSNKEPRSKLDVFMEGLR